MIHETLEKLQVPIEGLKPYHRNPRQGDVGTIMQSLELSTRFAILAEQARRNLQQIAATIARNLERTLR